MDNWYSARVHAMFENNGGAGEDMEMLTEEGMLSLAVVLGSSLSLVGLVFAFITYSLFSDLRSVAGTTLMNLLASLFLTQLLYVVGAGGVQAPDLCVSLALALHYSRLTVACWLLAATHDLYRTVKTQCGLVDCPPPTLASSFCKYSLLGWGLPLLFLGLATSIQLHEGGGMTESAAEELRPENCWFPSKKAFLVAFLIPYWLILIATIYYIVRGMLAIRWAAALAPTRKAQEKLSRRRRLQVFLFVRILLFIFITVMSGAACTLLGWRLAWVIFACSSALQGIFIALSVTCNCQVLKLYTRSIRARATQATTINYGTGSEMAKSASLQLLTWDNVPDTV